MIASITAVLTGCSSDGGNGADLKTPSDEFPGGAGSGEQQPGPQEPDPQEPDPQAGPPIVGPNIVGQEQEQTGPHTKPDAEGSEAASSGGNTGSGAADSRLTQAVIARRIFDPRLQAFNVRIFYEAGAEPYTGRLGLTSNDTWDITATSYRSLFSAHAGRNVSVPDRLAQMQGLPDQGIQDWSIADLLEVGNAWAPPLIADAAANVSVFFLNGTFEGNANVLGVHPTNSPFSFVFKDIVRSVGGDATTQRYVEQATVVHEMGHTIGFVDNGVPMVNAHEDTDHPHHTTDQNGVMYWQVESGNGILAFLTDIIVGGRLDLFGNASTLDAHNYMPSD